MFVLVGLGALRHCWDGRELSHLDADGTALPGEGAVRQRPPFERENEEEEEAEAEG